MTPNNVYAGSAKSGLVLHNPEKVLAVLDRQVQTANPSERRFRTGRTWVSETPRNTLAATSQSTLRNDCIAKHRGSSPTPMLDTVDYFDKGTKATMHEVTRFQVKNSSLRKANDSLSKRRSVPKPMCSKEDFCR